MVFYIIMFLKIRYNFPKTAYVITKYFLLHKWVNDILVDLLLIECMRLSLNVWRVAACLLGFLLPLAFWVLAVKINNGIC